MEHQFKVGEKVRMKQSCSGSERGNIYTLIDSTPAGALCASFDGSPSHGCTCSDKWELVTETATLVERPEPCKFILQYDDDTFEPHASEKDVRARIATLVDESAETPSFTVHDIKRSRLVKIGVKITISK